MVKQLPLKIGIYIWLSLVIVFAILSPNKVGMLDETTKNMYFHVPMSIAATLAFFSSMWFGFRYLRHKNLEDDLKAEAASGLGFLFNILAMATGAIWAKFMWGAYWHWDPRQTTIFLLFLIYSAYFALRSAVEVPEKRASLSSVYSIFAFPPVIFLYFILPRMVPGLHPGAPEKNNPDVNPSVSGSTDMIIRLTLYAAMIGFAALYFWMHNLRSRSATLSAKLEARAAEEPA
ncbi:cytochrome c assembly protein [Chloroherpeton thalassium ATCC 35110]|uniref:Heme exporter protein C n=2 Tax=Chloroherpeton thalassium TaxID=100716 RepID=B3QZ21_CHLT3|nr:cytochrome c assembly protein [Chloroherpeton thalassium ATCC 35110]